MEAPRRRARARGWAGAGGVAREAARDAREHENRARAHARTRASRCPTVAPATKPLQMGMFSPTYQSV
jgi:hypothetical protein